MRLTDAQERFLAQEAWAGSNVDHRLARRMVELGLFAVDAPWIASRNSAGQGMNGLTYVRTEYGDDLAAAIRARHKLSN